MSNTGLKAFDDTIHRTNTWLHEITSRMGWDERRKGYRLLRVALHAIRDWMDVAEISHLSAQLPLLVRGVFFEGWQPMKSRAGEDVDALLSGIAEAFPDDPDFDSRAAFCEVLSVMRMHLSEGEYAKLRRAMPNGLRCFWEEA